MKMVEAVERSGEGRVSVTQSSTLTLEEKVSSSRLISKDIKWFYKISLKNHIRF